MLGYVEMYFNKYTDFKEKLFRSIERLSYYTLLILQAVLSGKALFIDK